MKKTQINVFYTIILIYLALPISLFAQLCPGGGSTFATAVIWDPTWINGCSTGSSCTGGVSFSNKSTCEPITTMDNCAPTPTCTSSPQNASDLWFCATIDSTVVKFSVMQHVSFRVAIQAFTGSVTCSSLSQIGCALSSGPSSGVTLTMTGLTKGNTIYFRVYGSASAASQRTGEFCFCGTEGIKSGVLLPISFTAFDANLVAENQVALNWSFALESDETTVSLERKSEGEEYTEIYNSLIYGSAGAIQEGNYTDKLAKEGLNYYRLKYKSAATGDAYVYSNEKVVDIGSNNASIVYDYTSNVVSLTYPSFRNNCFFYISDLQGRILLTKHVTEDYSTISTNDLESGTYIMYYINNGKKVSQSLVFVL